MDDFMKMFSDSDLEWMRELDEDTKSLDVRAWFVKFLERSARRLVDVPGMTAQRVLVAKDQDAVFNRGVLNIFDSWHITTIVSKGSEFKVFLLTNGRIAGQILDIYGKPFEQDGMECLKFERIDLEYSTHFINHIAHAVIVMLKMHEVFDGEVRDLGQSIIQHTAR